MSISLDASALSRKRIRYGWHSILVENLQGIPANHIKRGRLADPKGMSPLIYVSSSSSNRPPLTVRGTLGDFEIDMFVLVLLDDPTNVNWTGENAEDFLDDIEAQVPLLMERYKSREGLWRSVEYLERTTIERVPLGGHDYIVEDIPLRFVYA